MCFSLCSLWGRTVPSDCWCAFPIVYVCDEFGNRRHTDTPTNPDEINAIISGERNDAVSTVPSVDHEGCYECSFVPTQSGQKTLSVYCNGEPISGLRLLFPFAQAPWMPIGRRSAFSQNLEPPHHRFRRLLMTLSNILRMKSTLCHSMCRSLPGRP